MSKATKTANAATSNNSQQTMNLTDRTAPRRPRANSVQSSDSEATSSSGSSSEDNSEDESEAEEHSDHEMNDTRDPNTRVHATDSSLPHIGGRPKPRIHRMQGDSELLSRLNAFLPKMKSANEDLQKQIMAGNAGDLVLDNADEHGEQYIEMDLGLGVLEEKRDGQSSSEDESDEESDDATRAGEKPKDINDSDIIGKLMGGKGKKLDTDKPSIEEMAE